jgi:hypothetical protein
MKNLFLIVVLGLSGCTTMKSNKQSNTDKNDKVDSKAPFLTSPKVRKVWVPEKIEGDKFIEGHWMWVLERTSSWSQ